MTDTEQSLRTRDKVFLLCCVLVAAASLAIGIPLYPKVNPEASIDFRVDRGSSEDVASRFLEELGLDVSGYRHASRFTFDRDSKIFLERTVGLERSNELVRGPVKMWRWGHRWFRPLQREEIVVEVATTGSVAAFEHTIEEDAPGAYLDPADARVLAERFLHDRIGIDPSSLEFVEAREEERPHRIDHTFVWKAVDQNLQWAGGTYRYEVRIQGDQPGAYKEYIKVPEGWTRDYGSLRSRNNTTALIAASLLALTVFAVLFVFFRRIRLKDIRWRTAGVFGLIGVILIFLSGLNSLPTKLYDYATTESFASFLFRTIVTSLLGALAAGLFIFVLTGAGEALYREAFPRKLSLGRFFTPRGIRTRRFLLSSVAGLTLTCVFFAYQGIFYLVTKRLGGWAPADVPYTELLNTAVPWVFILLIGFSPAVTEEFLSRMFSIPFLRKYTRSIVLAVVVPAAIWGFAHANYPNQPFYIRGIEVGMAGVAIGIVMLRFNILATLVWHYTIDALYTSILLFRSGNTYYIVSAALASGVILLPLGYAVFSYVRRRQFEPATGLLNESEPKPIELGEAAPAAGAPPPPRPWPRRSKTIAVAASAALLLLFLLPSGKVREPGNVRLGRGAAREAADGYLRALGEEPDSYRVGIIGSAGLDEHVARYVLQHGDLEKLREISGRYAGDFRWVARYFRPLSPREVGLEISGRDGELLELDRHLFENDSLPSLNSDAAQQVARAFLEKRAIDVDSLSLKESSVENLPHRLDHTYLWEAGEGDPRNLDDAHHRVKVVVQGDEVGAFDSFLKLPEAWVREREKRTALWALRLILVILAGGLFLGLALWVLIDGHRKGETRWARSLALGLPFGVLGLLSGLNAWPSALVQKYSTEMPWNLYVISFAAGVAIGAGVVYLVSVACVAFLTTAYPRIWGLGNPGYRAAAIRNALLASVISLAVMSAVSHLESSLGRLLPAIAPEPNLPAFVSTTTAAPWFSLVFSVLRSWLLILGAAAAVLVVVGLRQRQVRGIPILVAFGLIALVPLTTRGPGEFLVGLLLVCIRIGALVALVRWVLRDNLLAYPLAALVLVAAARLAPYLGAGGAYFRTQGWIALVLLAVPVVWLVLDSLRRRAPDRMSDPIG